MKKINVTIGIPAYNEEANIRHLLLQLLKQDIGNCHISSIIIASDGSRDNTVREVNKVKNKNIHLINNSSRKGIANRLNQIINYCNSDILVIINADISIEDPHFIEKLIEPIIKNNVDLTSVKFIPLTPINTFERILEISINMKRHIFERVNKGDNVYTCHGFARAFSKRLYKSIFFSESIGEDAFSYLYCKYNQFKYEYIRNTCIYYKLPNTLRDHEKQSIRYLQSITKFRHEFGDSFINNEYGGSSLTFGFNITLLLQALLYSFMKSPAYTSLYIFLALITRIKALCARKMSNTWDVAKSSKQLITSI